MSNHSNYKIRLLHTLLGMMVFWMVLICPFEAMSQLYPVTINFNVLPPHSPLLHTFTDQSMSPNRANRIVLSLRLNDLNEPNLPVRLVWEFSGPQGNIRSSENAAAPVINLSPGQITMLGNKDMGEYLNPGSLVGLDVSEFIRSGGFLQEGTWTICVTAYDLLRGSQVSNQACQTLFLEEHLPPEIWTPVDSVVPNFPQNVEISWRPRHHAVFPVQYTVNVWEDIAGMTPDQITLSSFPLVSKQVTGVNTMFLTSSDPPLYEGNTYWVQVQVKDVLNGPNGPPVYLFRDNGYSQLESFIYGLPREEGCDEPDDINYIEDDNQDIYVYWDGGDPPANLGGDTGADPNTRSSSVAQFPTLRYGNLANLATSLRTLSKNNLNPITTSTGPYYQFSWRDLTEPSDWEQRDTDDKWIQLENYRRGHIYQYVVKTICSLEELISDTLYIELSTLPPERPYKCGQPPLDLQTSNRNPLPFLNEGDTIIAGDVRVYVLYAEGQDGTFSGEGFFQSPMLNSIKLGVQFDGIFINDEYRLVSGEIQTIFDETGSNIMDVDSTLGLFVGDDEQIPEINIDSDIDSVAINELGEIIVYLPGGETIAITEQPVKITGADGTVYVVSGGYVMPEVDLDNIPDQFEEGFEVTFVAHPDQNYGFDAYKPALDGEYEDNDGYKMPYKSVAYGGRDVLFAEIDFQDPSLIDSIEVYTEDGVKLEHVIEDGRIRIRVVGLDEGKKVVHVVIKDRSLVGSFNLVTYPLYTLYVHLVPVNGVGANIDPAAVQEQVNKILGQGLFNVNVDLLDVYLTYTDPDGVINVENHFLESYADDMQVIMQSFRQRQVMDGTEYYIYLVDNLEGGVTGFMPRGLTEAFVDPTDNLSTTLAHELGHGPFTLKHSWQTYPSLTRGSSDNLMDYSNTGSIPGTALYFKQWETMQNADIVLPFLMDEEQGAMEETVQLSSENCQKLQQLVQDYGYTFNQIEDCYQCPGLENETRRNCIGLSLIGENNCELLVSVEPNQILLNSNPDDSLRLFKDGVFVKACNKNSLTGLNLCVATDINSFINAYLDSLRNLLNQCFNADLVDYHPDEKLFDFADISNTSEDGYFINREILKGFEEANSWGLNHHIYSSNPINTPAVLSKINESINEGDGPDLITHLEFYQDDQGATKYKLNFYFNDNFFKAESESLSTLGISQASAADQTQMESDTREALQSIITYASNPEVFLLSNLKSTQESDGTAIPNLEDSELELGLKRDVGFFEKISGVAGLIKVSIDDIKVPERVWYISDTKYEETFIKIGQFPSGIGDGVVEELKSIPELVILAKQVVTDANTRQGIKTALSDIPGLARKIWDDKVANYSDPEKRFHTGGKDGVQVLSMFYGGAILGKANFLIDIGEAGKLVLNLLKKVPVKTDIISDFGAKLGNQVNEILAKFPSDFNHPFYQKLIGQSDEIHREILDFIADLGIQSADDLQKLFDDLGQFPELMDAVVSNPKLLKAWKVVNNRNSQIRIDGPSLEAINKILSNPHWKALGLTDEILGGIKGSKNLAFKDVLKTLDDFGLSLQSKNINISDFNKVLDDLVKGDGWTEGAEWTLKFISSNTNEFSSKLLRFEVYEKWDDISSSYIRISDLIDETNTLSKVMFEFKSVKNVPPGKFNEQFVKDLANPDVVELSQLKWIFDGRKSPLDFQNNMTTAINNLPLTDDLARKFLDANSTAVDLKDVIISEFDNIFRLID